jgi:phosphatidyl-myo-inositol dimannoside synthase
VHVAFLSSTPPSATEGSGTFVACAGLAQGLTQLGHSVSVRPLRVRTGFHTFDRWLYNALAALRPPLADLVVGVDLDGFLWARRRAPGTRFVVALKGVIADELRNERGWVRTLLGVQARWEGANARGADRVIVPSRYSAAVATEAYGLRPETVRVVPEALDVAEWRRRLEAARREPRDAGFRVLAVARMYPRKRLQDLLDATALLRARIPDVQTRIVGDGPELASLRERHARLGLGDSVVFLGEVSRGTLTVEYVSADCFCLPTVQEGFGMVFAEAMMAGLPIVACRAAAVPEVVEDRRTGLLVNPRSPGELAMALETLATNEGLRKELGEAGRQRVEAFDVVPVARRFLAAVA